MKSGEAEKTEKRKRIRKKGICRSALLTPANIVSMVFVLSVLLVTPETGYGQISINFFEEPFEYDQWVIASAGGARVEGDRARFLQRHGYHGDAFGGVDDFHWEKFLENGSLIKFDGRGLVDLNNYELIFDWRNEEKGYLSMGFRETRTWYDGSGGFFPQNGAWITIFDEEHSLDRGEIWIEFGRTVPEQPQLFLRYTHRFREGTKDSTSWGDTTLTGGFGARGIVPAFQDIDETSDIVEAWLEHTHKQTDITLKLRYEAHDTNNARKARMRPGETADRSITHREISESDIFVLHAYSKTQLRENVLITAGALYSTVDTNFSGNRIYGSDFDSIYDPTFQRRNFDEGFLNLQENSNLEQFVLNLNLVAKLRKHLRLLTAIRLEKLDTDISADLLETNFISFRGGAIEKDVRKQSDRGWNDISGSVELRFTGLENFVVSIEGFWSEGDGELQEEEIATEFSRTTFQRQTDWTRKARKFSARAKWYPALGLSMSSEYYHKTRDNAYDHIDDPTVGTNASNYPAYIEVQDFETDDVNFRLTWRPYAKLTLTTRYDFQVSTIDTAGPMNPASETAETRTHIVSQSAAFFPIPRLYIQGSVSYVRDRTKTGIAEAASELGLLIAEIENDFWTATLTGGIALNEKTDLRAQLFYYDTNNYVDNSEFGQPFGSSVTELGLTLKIDRRIRENLRWALQYRYLDNNDTTSGGNNDFDAHVVYSTLQYRF